MRIAASLLLLAILGVSLVYYYRQDANEITVTAAQRKGQNSYPARWFMVYLNANTSISYSKHFNKKSREVRAYRRSIL